MVRQNSSTNKKKRQVAEVRSQTPYASPEIHRGDRDRNHPPNKQKAEYIRKKIMTNKNGWISIYFQVFVKIWVNLYLKNRD